MVAKFVMYTNNVGIVWVRKGKIMVKCGAAPPFFALYWKFISICYNFPNKTNILQ